jgi:hypothetical protein
VRAELRFRLHRHPSRHPHRQVPATNPLPLSIRVRVPHWGRENRGPVPLIAGSASDDEHSCASAQLLLPIYGCVYECLAFFKQVTPDAPADRDFLRERSISKVDIRVSPSVGVANV